MFMVALQFLGSLGAQSKKYIQCCCCFRSLLLNYASVFVISVRVFTTIQSIADPVYLLGYLIGASLSGIMLGQIIFYRGAAPASIKPKKQQ